MTFTAFPGHAGRWWPLVRWRSRSQRTDVPALRGLLPLRVEPSYNRNVHGERGDLEQPQPWVVSGGASR